MLLHFHGSTFNIMLTVTYVGHQPQGNPLLHFHGSMFNIMFTVTYVGHQHQGNPLLHLPWWQQWLHESPTMLHYTYIVHLVTNSGQIAAQPVSFLTDCGTLKLVTVFTAAYCSSNWSQSKAHTCFKIHQIQFSYLHLHFPSNPLAPVPCLHVFKFHDNFLFKLLGYMRE